MDCPRAMDERKRVLLSGGTGFVGRRLLRHLRERGDEVTVVTRDPARRAGGEGVSYAAWLPDVSGFDAVLHLAGEPIFGQRWDEGVKHRILLSRKEGTARIVDSMASTPDRPRVLVSASAVGYYGDGGERLLPEAAPPGQDFMAEVCKVWEREALRATELGLRVACLRFGIVLGPEGGALKQLLLPFKLGVGGPIGSGRQYMSWIHVEDLARLIVHAMVSPGVHGAVNAVAPAPVTNKEFSKALGRALHRPAVLPLPPFALRLALGEVASVVTMSQRCVPEKALAAGFEFAHPEIDEALRDLLR